MSISYTPEEITEILNDYFSGITHKQYIGARYVPIFGRKDEDSIIWDNTGTYEPLTIVLYQGNSYTSRQYVPIGVDIDNAEYWANTGNYNAQVEQYRQEVSLFDGRIDFLEGLNTHDPVYYGADPTGTNDSSDAIAQCIAANPGSTIVFTPGTYKVSESIVIPYDFDERVSIDFNGSEIIPSNNFSPVLYIGGDATTDLPSDYTDRVQRKWFYKNGTINNSTHMHSLTGIQIKSGQLVNSTKWVAFTNAVIDNMNILNFDIGIQVGERAGWSAADAVIHNCMIKHEYTEDTVGILFNSTDCNVDMVRIYGYQYAIESNSSSGLVITNVHNIDNGATTYQQIEEMAFMLLANSFGGYIIDNCYCDACGTFVKVDNENQVSRIEITLTNSFMYSPGGIPHNMTVIDLSGMVANTNYNAGEIYLHVHDNIFNFNTVRTVNRGIVFPPDSNLVMFLNSFNIDVSNNTVLKPNTLVIGDFLLGTYKSIKPYQGNITLESGYWLEIARIPIHTMVVNSGSLDVNQCNTNCEINNVRWYAIVNGNGSVNTLSLKVNTLFWDNSDKSFGASIEFIEELNVYELVIYMRSANEMNGNFSVGINSASFDLLINPSNVLIDNTFATTWAKEVTPYVTVDA